MANCLLTAEKEILDEQIYESWVFFFNLELMLRKKKAIYIQRSGRTIVIYVARDWLQFVGKLEEFILCVCLDSTQTCMKLGGQSRTQGYNS